MTEMTGITGSTHHASRPGGPAMGPADSQTLSILDPFLRFRNPDVVGFANSAAPIETTHAIIQIQKASSWKDLSKFGICFGPWCTLVACLGTHRCVPCKSSHTSR